jgi:hypothetical protein
VAPGDVHALADAIGRLAQDRELREQMGRSAQERYRTLFAPAAVVPLLVETYERVMRNGAQTSAASGNGHFHPWRDSMNRKVTSVSVRGGSDLDSRWSTGTGQSSVISVVGGLLFGGQQLISWICENW